jgi:hypothetical protein
MSFSFGAHSPHIFHKKVKDYYCTITVKIKRSLFTNWQLLKLDDGVYGGSCIMTLSLLWQVLKFL